MSNEIKEKEEYEKYARDHRKELDAQEVKLGDVVKVLVGQFAGETGVIVSISACRNDYTDPYYEADMNCEVPEKYKCRKTLITPNNVIGGLSATDFEVIGNRAPKQPPMEIKQGDTVRVSKDIPQFYRRYNSYRVFEVEHQVVDIEDGLALLDSIPIQYVTTIPTKYLIKVDAEAKEPAAPTIKVGDRVCCYNVLHLKGSKKEDYMGIVTSITYMGITVQLDNGGMMFSCCESDLELVQPKKQTEAEKTKIKDDKLVFPITFDLSDSYWDAYTADLARDIAVKSMEKSYGCDPERIADYAVSVAKAVMEGLKRK